LGGGAARLERATVLARGMVRRRVPSGLAGSDNWHFLKVSADCVALGTLAEMLGQDSVHHQSHEVSNPTIRSVYDPAHACTRSQSETRVRTGHTHSTPEADEVRAHLSIHAKQRSVPFTSMIPNACITAWASGRRRRCTTSDGRSLPAASLHRLLVDERPEPERMPAHYVEVF
jgi:hypothetical protein